MILTRLDGPGPLIYSLPSRRRQAGDEPRTATQRAAQRDHREFTLTGVLESNEAEPAPAGGATWLTS